MQRSTGFGGAGLVFPGGWACLDWGFAGGSSTFKGTAIFAVLSLGENAVDHGDADGGAIRRTSVEDRAVRMLVPCQWGSRANTLRLSIPVQAQFRKDRGYAAVMSVKRKRSVLLGFPETARHLRIG